MVRWAGSPSAAGAGMRKSGRAHGCAGAAFSPGPRARDPHLDHMNTPADKKSRRGTRARSVARKLAMQALYQWQMTGHEANDIAKQFIESEEFAGADREYFEEMLRGCIKQKDAINAAIAPFIDRPLDQLDPVETAILMMSMFELQSRLDVPYRVVINEAIDLAKRFGATDAHKYVNAVLDRAAKELRAAERG
jgi:N utilization substance protein B